jgi:hypothetical protein
MIHIIALLLHVNITLDLMVREVSRKTMEPWFGIFCVWVSGANNKLIKVINPIVHGLAHAADRFDYGRVHIRSD